MPNQWDETKFFSSLEAQIGARNPRVVRDAISWAKSVGLGIRWSGGVNEGMFFAFLSGRDTPNRIFGVHTNGVIFVEFRDITQIPPFTSLPKRRELITRLGKVPELDTINNGVNPRISMEALGRRDHLQRFLQVVGWIIQEIKASETK